MALDVVARDGGLINDVAAGADCGGLYRTLIPVQNGGGEGAGQVGGGGALGRSAPRGDGLEVENKIRGRSGAGVADRVEIVRSVKSSEPGPASGVRPLMCTSTVPSLIIMNSSRACRWGAWEAWPTLRVVMCDSNFSKVADGRLTTSRSWPTAVVLTLSCSQMKTWDLRMAGRTAG